MNNPYHLIPVILAVILLYLISWGLTQLGEIRLITHRRLWNTLLLITFLVTGLLGLLLAIQINYKLEIPWIKTALKWHVDFGIAMVGAALLHLMWHLQYYSDIWSAIWHKRQTAKEIINSVSHPTQSTFSVRQIVVALILLGFTSIMSQLLHLRRRITTWVII